MSNDSAFPVADACADPVSPGAGRINTAAVRSAVNASGDTEVTARASRFEGKFLATDRRPASSTTIYLQSKGFKAQPSKDAPSVGALSLNTVAKGFVNSNMTITLKELTLWNYSKKQWMARHQSVRCQALEIVHRHQKLQFVKPYNGFSMVAARNRKGAQAFTIRDHPRMTKNDPDCSRHQD